MITTIKKTISNLPGWRTKRKIVVFESDDWGSIRMPSKKVFNDLVKKGFTIENDPYCRFDSLERGVDLERLFDVLVKFKDKNGKHPVFTALCLVANPDFEKIRQCDFERYLWEPVTITFGNYPGSENAFQLWNQGINAQVFVPQFHGREHLNVVHWMNDLQVKNKDTLTAFDYGVWGVYSPNIKNEYQAAFNITAKEQLPLLMNVINEGIGVFKSLLNYTPKVFVPPNGPFNLSLENELYKQGLEYIVLDKFQKEPKGDGSFAYHIRYLGQKSSSGLVYLSRNCVFEPTQFPTQDNIRKCVSDIDLMFKLGKPAIISTHRLNYIGTHDVRNQQESLNQLQTLLFTLINKWPDIEFMTSLELGHLINNINR